MRYLRLISLLRPRLPRARRAALTAMIAVLALVLPATGPQARNFLDRWWEDVTGKEGHHTIAPSPGQAGAAETPASSSASQPTPAPAPAPQATPAALVSAPPSIEVATPKVRSVTDTLTVTGNAAAVTQVKLIARVVGYLEQLHFQDGSIVNKGDLLATIQQDEYKAQLEQAEAQLRAQQAALKYASTEVVRYTALLKRDAATQVDVDHWTFEKETALANIAAAQAQIAIAKLNLSYTEVRAPFDGQMGRHLVDPGNVVGGNGQEAALADISQLDPIYVQASISTQQALQIRANLDQRRLTLQQLQQVPISVALSGETGFAHRGHMDYVAPQIDPATGTLFIRGILSNPDRTLLPGIFVNIQLPMGRTVSSALLVPDSALQEDQGGRYLMVVGPGNVLQQRYVSTGELIGGLRVITGGLQASDQLVVGQLWQATPGLKITPKPTTISE